MSTNQPPQSRVEEGVHSMIGDQVELEPSQSRVEKIIHSMCGEQITLESSQSRLEEDLLALKEVIEHGGGGEAVIEPLSATQNGTYTPSSGVDGYSPVTVNVPNSYEAGDEGKVVSNGALVAQGSQTITENGTYDTTLNNEVVVNVSGGGSETNDILFHFDKDFSNVGEIDCEFKNTAGLSISSEQSKFGFKSLKCDGKSQVYNNVTLENGFQLGADDFTLDFWVYPINLTSLWKVPVSFNYRSLAIYIRLSSFDIAVAKRSDEWAFDISENVSIVNNQWYHIAVVRDGSFIYTFLNGVKVHNINFGSDSIADIGNMTVGSTSNAGYKFTGYIDEIRLIKGKAVWTDNFTPPTEPYIQSGVVQMLSITENGTYTPPKGVSAYNPIIVNVRGSYPWLDATYAGVLDGYEPVVTHNEITGQPFIPSSTYIEQAVSSGFSNDIYDLENGKKILGSNISKTISQEQAHLPVPDFEQLWGVDVVAKEYAGYIYDTSKITDLGLVLLGDFSQGGSESENVLNDSIENYSGIILQGIYRTDKGSEYNISILYQNIVLLQPYWAGMKDRNNSYTCKVTFTDATHCNLSGNRQVLIYGIP